MTTLDALLTIPPRNTDTDAWRVRIEARRAENRQHLEIERAAAAALGKRMERPAQRPAPERSPAPIPSGKGMRIFGVVPCIECERPTRPQHTSAAEHPGTVARKAHGLCSACYQRGYQASKRGAA